jgi:hypothetical protein
MKLFRRAKDIDGCNFGNTDTKQVMSPRIDILEITESFSEIYSKLSKRIF